MKKANPKAVGGFVLAAVILALVAVAVFGSGQFFERKVKLVAFFPGSLQGLRVGAPVNMRGVQIGKVTEIWVEFDEETLEFAIPVLMDIEVSRIRGAKDREDPRQAAELIDMGLRAQLVAQSLVTGQQTIQLGFHPDTPVTLVETKLPYRQLPTLPSKFEKLQSSIDTVAEQAGVVLAQISDLLSEENRGLVRQTLKNLGSLTGGLDERVKQIDPIIADLRDIAAQVKENEPKLAKFLDDASATVMSYKKLAQSADKLIQDNQKGIGDFTNTGLYEFTNLAVDAQATMEQLRRVLEEMERDPARFFLGKPGEVEVK